MPRTISPRCSLFILAITILIGTPSSVFSNTPADSSRREMLKDSILSVQLNKARLEVSRMEYEMQNGNNTPGPWFLIVLSSILSVVSIAAGIASGLMASKWQSRLEIEKWKRQQDESFDSELLTNVRHLTTDMAAAVHSMCWLCWLAFNGPERLSRARIREYDEEMHKLLPLIAGRTAVIAGMDFQMYLNMKITVNDIYRFDAQIGLAGLEFHEHQPETAKALAELFQAVGTYENTFSVGIAEAIQQYGKKRGKG